MESIAPLIPSIITALGTTVMALVLAIHYRSSLRQFWAETQGAREKVAAVIAATLVVLGPSVALVSGSLYMVERARARVMLDIAAGLSETHETLMGGYRTLAESHQTLQGTLEEFAEGSLEAHRIATVTLNLQGKRIEELENEIANLASREEIPVGTLVPFVEGLGCPAEGGWESITFQLANREPDTRTYCQKLR